MAKSIASRFRIEPGRKIRLARLDPAESKTFPDRQEAEALSARNVLAIDGLQDRLYAEGRRALLVVLQGTDTSGKDGTIKHVFKETSPLGVTSHAFKKPTELELAHDFLWRVHAVAPPRGFVGIFNRSHYEDVLVCRVRKLAPRDEIEARYDQINAFEKMLSENGTVVLKFMLHISKKEQGNRLQERLDERKGQWKFNPGDLEDRKLWDEYRKAYEIMLERCSTKWAPWHVIPADSKWARNAAISAIVRETLEDMNPQYPKPDWDPKSFKIV